MFKCIGRYIFLIIALVTPGMAEESLLRIISDEDAYRVTIVLNGKELLSSPSEGLWSIADSWQNHWPANWQHARAREYIRVGDWHILKGELKMGNGVWKLSDSYRSMGRVVKGVRRFEWHGKDTLRTCTLSVRFRTSGKGKSALLPGIIYYGNPSGARSGRTPVYMGQPGEVALYEEHRFPMPFASLEWPEDGRYWSAALHSLPCPVPFGNLPDQWWSLGLIAREDGTEFVLFSGPTASNGKRSVVKAVQQGFLPYENAWLNIPPGTVIEKTFYLQADSTQKGQGFREPVAASLEIFKPDEMGNLPLIQDIVRAKYRYAKKRWTDEGRVAGFREFVDQPYFVLGWTGQAAAPGYAFQVLEDELGDKNIKDMVQRSLDFVSTTEFYDQGFHTWYDIDKGKWFQPYDNPEILSQGQAMNNIANAIRVGRQKGMQTATWEAFLKKASDFHAERILSSSWDPASTNEGFFIAPLCQAYQLLGVEKYRKAAEKAGCVYAKRHLSMEEPYWGGTLDASCEDKEGAWAAFQGFLALYEMTGEDVWLRRAQHAADVVLIYVVVWNIDIPAGRLRNHDFKTCGWTAVSVQNQHLDVYGVLIAPSLYRLGQITKNQRLQRLAIVMFKSCGQLIDPYGSQGEQIQQTNYAQRGNMTDVFRMRGQYVEEWTVFWITAHFLNAAAQFREMSVW